MEDTKIKVSYEKLLTFRRNAQMYVQIHMKEKMNKFAYALTKMISRTNELEAKYHDKLHDLRVDKASLDEKGNLISRETQQGNNTITKYEFTPKALKELNKDIRDIGKSEVEIEPYICTGAIPDDVTFPMKEVFHPFVIKDFEDKEPEDEPKEEEKK